MFEGPEYASYIALCRELRLPREWEEADCYIPEDVTDISSGAYLAGQYDAHEGIYDPRKESGIWLPRLDQWLSMLEEAGATQMYWEKTASIGWYRLFLDPQVLESGYPDADLMTAGPTHEEACARLWMAVTGR